MVHPFGRTHFGLFRVIYIRGRGEALSVERVEGGGSRGVCVVKEQCELAW